MVSNDTTDYEHNCNSSIASLDNEDVFIIGRWDDYTGSDYSLRTSFGDIQNQNLGNRLMGTEAWVRDNAKLPPFTVRGNNALITRARRHIEFIKDVKHPGDKDPETSNLSSRY